MLGLPVFEYFDTLSYKDGRPGVEKMVQRFKVLTALPEEIPLRLP